MAPSEIVTYCVPEITDPMVRAHLYISAVRTRIHVHESHPCHACLGDVMGLGQHGFALMNLLADAERQIEDLRALISDFVDDDPCDLDHHGYCQAHSLQTDCPHARAKKLLGIGGDAS